MTRILRTTLVMFALAFVAGCNDFQTPQGIAATAFSAMNANDLDAFKLTLIGDALASYGSPAGLATLEQLFDGKTPNVGELSILDDQHRAANAWEVPFGGYRLYSLPILSSSMDDPTLIVNLKIRCTWKSEQSNLQQEDCRIEDISIQ